MANLTIQNYDNAGIQIGNDEFEEGTLQFPGADTYAAGTILAKKEVSDTIVATRDGTNTGDGTVTAVALAPGGPPIIGAWNLEVTATGVNGRNAGTVTPDGSNTGTGTVTALAIAAGEFPEIGSWVLTCTDPNEGGTPSSTAVTITGTGDGAPGSVTPGVDVVEGLYTLTCIEAVAHKGRFEVADPNGNRLEDMNVTVAYTNTHFAITVADGANDYIVGDTLTFTITIAHGGLFSLVDPDGVTVKSDIELPGGAGGTVDVDSGGITFTITDAGTDFALDDFFTMTVVAAEGGTFKLEDPNGDTVAIGLTLSGVATGATVFVEGGMTFTITDGAADFAVGDKFSLTVVADGDWVIYALDGLNGSQTARGILTIEEVATGATDVSFRPLISGKVRAEKIFTDALPTTAITDLIKAQLHDAGIYAVSVDELNIQDNQ